MEYHIDEIVKKSSAFLLKDFQNELGVVQEEVNRILKKYEVKGGITCGFLLDEFSFFIDPTFTKLV